jgi:hypothetical protein
MTDSEAAPCSSQVSSQDSPTRRDQTAFAVCHAHVRPLLDWVRHDSLSVVSYFSLGPSSPRTYLRQAGCVCAERAMAVSTWKYVSVMGEEGPREKYEMAERERFELSSGINRHTISSRAPSATRTPFRKDRNQRNRMFSMGEVLASSPKTGVHMLIGRFFELRARDRRVGRLCRTRGLCGRMFHFLPRTGVRLWPLGA